jgi:hypothetical protein
VRENRERTEIVRPTPKQSDLLEFVSSRGATDLRELERGENVNFTVTVIASKVTRSSANNGCCLDNA